MKKRAKKRSVTTPKGFAAYLRRDHGLAKTYAYVLSKAIRQHKNGHVYNSTRESIKSAQALANHPNPIVRRAAKKELRYFYRMVEKGRTEELFTIPKTRKGKQTKQS
jgi:hypothetical protein